jgi:glucose-6-phosphate 1-dehydrogenase
VRTNTVRAQYRSLDGNGPTYRKEPGVAPNSETPTYAALELYIDNWRWQGVPFYLRSGKALAEKVTEVTVRFKEVPHMLFDTDHAVRLAPNELSFCLQPDEGFHLGFQTKIPGAGMRTEPVDMTFLFAPTFGEKALPEAYERLLLDALLGDASLFSRADEIEYSWRIIDAIQQAWDRGEGPPLGFYEPGTWGPSAADILLAASNRSWALNCTRQ